MKEVSPTGRRDGTILKGDTLEKVKEEMEFGHVTNRRVGLSSKLKAEQKVKVYDMSYSARTVILKKLKESKGTRAASDIGHV